jgi:hypothetical protein
VEQQRVERLLEAIQSVEPSPDMSPSEQAQAQRAAAPLKAQLLAAQSRLARCHEAQCPKNDDCNTPGWVDLDFVGAKASETASARSWAEVKSEIFCDRATMGYAYGTPGVVGHVVVINGYQSANGTDYLQLHDPWSPCAGTVRLLSYADYVDPAGTSTHWNTWFDVQKK